MQQVINCLCLVYLPESTVISYDMYETTNNMYENEWNLCESESDETKVINQTTKYKEHFIIRLHIILS